MEKVGSTAIRSTGKQKWRCRGMEAPGAAGDGELSRVPSDVSLGLDPEAMVPRPHHTLDQEEPLLQ